MGDRTPKAKDKAKKQQAMQRDRQQAARAAKQQRQGRYEEGGTATLPNPDEQLPPS